MSKTALTRRSVFVFVLLALFGQCSQLLSAPPPWNITDFVDDVTDSAEKVTSGIGERTRSGKKEYHPGTDIAVQNDTTGKYLYNDLIRAGLTGKVVAIWSGGDHYDAWELPDDYNVVIIEFDNKFWAFGHLLGISVSVGDDVQPSTVIGQMGGVGQDNATGARCDKAYAPHLHLEVHEDQGEAGWDGADSAAINTPTGVYDPFLMPVVKTGGTGSGNVVGSRYEYSFSNDVGMDPIDYLRLDYGGGKAPTNILSPTGWTGEYNDAGGNKWLEWYTATADILEGTSLGGFSYESSGPAGLVPYYLAPIDNHSLFTSDHDSGFVDGMMITGIVPEPATLSLLVVGFVGLVLRRRERKRAIRG